MLLKYSSVLLILERDWPDITVGLSLMAEGNSMV